MKRILLLLLLAATALTLWGCRELPSATTGSTEPPATAGWILDAGSHYYVTVQGSRLTGWLEMDGHIYYLDPARSGAAATGWLTIDGSRYHFDENGVMSTGWLKTGDGRVYLTAAGPMATGKYRTPEGWYFFKDNGVPATGWIGHGEKRYYAADDGLLSQGLTQVGSHFYFFDDEGAMHTGWLRRGNDTYYFYEDGTAARGKVELQGKTHYFSSRGMEILLVNPWNPIDAGYEPELVEVVNMPDGRIATACYDALQAMWADCQAAGFKPFFCSGYRTVALQETYFDSWVDFLMTMHGFSYESAVQAARTEVAYPGTSEHHLGIAVDILDEDHQYLDERQAETPTQKWLMEHCWEYGFILRYPEGSTAYTGIIYEPWHYRYVGLELAQELKELGICLEEYLQRLTEGSL